MVGEAHPSMVALERIEAVERANTAEGLPGSHPGPRRLRGSRGGSLPGAGAGLQQSGSRRGRGGRPDRIGKEAVEPLLSSLDAHNYGARAWAVRALAGIGDVRGLDVLEDALSHDIGPSVRRAAARGLGPALRRSRPEDRAPVRERCLVALRAAGRMGSGWCATPWPWASRGWPCPCPSGHPHNDRAEASLAQLLDPELEDTLVVRLRADLALERLKAR